MSSWTSFTSKVWGLNNAVETQTVANGIRYVGGQFTMADQITGAGVALPTISEGTAHALAFPEINGTLLASHSDGADGWYIGGSFTRVGGQERHRLAHIDALSQVTSWNPGANNTVYALTADNGTVYAGGNFTAAGGGEGNALRDRQAAFDTNGNLLDK